MADNIITRTISNYRHNRDIKHATRLINEIDSIARAGINHQITTRDAIPTPGAKTIGGSKAITGKLKKKMAPNRGISPAGIYTNKFNMSDIYATYVAENLMKFSMDKYAEAVVRNGYFIKSKNKSVTRYLMKRLKEIEIVSSSNTNELVKDMAVSIIGYGNTYLIKHRQLNASSGKAYTRWDGKKLKPIASLYVEDTRKLLLGEGPAGRMRYVRLPYDVSSVNLNAINPSLFSLPKDTLITADENLYNFVYNMFSTFSGAFRLSSKRRKDYVIYDDDEVDHIRYHHIPGEKIAMPPFWPTLNDIDSLRRIEENIELLVFQYGHPILHGTIGDDKKSGQEDEIIDLYTKLQDMESNGFVITDNRVLLSMIGAEGNSLRLDAYLMYFYRRVLTGLWLSEVTVGNGKTANRSTANVLDKLSQEKVFEIQSIISDAMQPIMIELLLEAGASLDWILRPENIPTWIFKSIDIEGKIKHENHVLTMWEASMITHDEMRAGIGEEQMTNAEIQTTYVNMVAIPLKKAAPPAAGTAGSSKSIKKSGTATQKSIRPANQHGKKTGPSQPQNG